MEGVLVKTIETHLQEAIYLDNRGFIKEAKLQYDQVIDHLQQFDAESLTRISSFYHSQRQYDVVFNASKIGIEKLGNLNILGPLFLTAWERMSQELHYIEWLLVQPGIDYLLSIKLRIAEHLLKAGKLDKAYMISLEVAEKIEHEFRENPSQSSLYIDILLHLVGIEFELGNLTQARFHLRKLIFLKWEYLERGQDIAYWAILLDEMTHLIMRPDWSHNDWNLSDDVQLIAQFYEELAGKVLSKNLVQQLRSKPFQDQRLEQKRKIYIRFIKKMGKQSDWNEGIEEAFQDNPNDLLLTLLYADFLKEERPTERASFWKREFTKHADRPEAIKAYWNTSEKHREQKKLDVDLDDCEITFLGGGEKIGGTSILISVKGHHILLDAGMHLHEEVYHPDYSPLLERGISFEDIDALLISHAHLDHTGAIPYIYKQQADIPIYATEATRNLMKLLLIDSVRMDNETHRLDYSEDDVHAALLSIHNVDFSKTFIIPSGHDEWKITYFPSGHILGAGAIHIEMQGISILFTGDYSVDEQKTVLGLDLPDDLSVDILITESTYGFLPTNASLGRARQEKLFVESIKRTMDKRGSMLIPAFAVGRAQEIILILKEAFKEERYLPFNLFIDGRVTDVCRIYQRYAEKGQYINPAFYQKEEEEQIFFGGGVQAAQEIYSNRFNSPYTFKDFMEDYISPGNNCIVASSGMLTDNSASARYAASLIEEEKNAISFTGYMDEESPGHKILQTRKTGEIETTNVNGDEKEVHARIESFRLSAHASREQILGLIVTLQPKRVFLMHGEHTKKYKPTQTIVGGEKIYPSIIDLLGFLNDKMTITAAFNGQTYHLY
ncbi:MBL fold metallo-hydrolase [Bacillus niameyensis]|uniref:MBL fold metallo-hydrolase n=1 Tax=Bacillus niameyensis TaxID=1522308 RepID=UPI0007806D5A|nr:MBL fold metallo-hydrolase [Bacillus niameyensis]